MANAIDLKDRIAVVTGGAQGIGRAITERFIASGARVAIWDLDKGLADKTAKELGQATKAYAVDVTTPDSIDAGVKATLGDFRRIDILVNNAGIAGGNAPTWELPVADWQRVLKINLDGPFYCCRAVAPTMIAQKFGRIINIASIAGKEGNPNAAHYSASKAGVIALTKSLAKELAQYDISGNAITPAAAKTAISDQTTQHPIAFTLSKTPPGRFVTVDEIAALAAWAASQDCSFTTGTVLDISGGRATY